MTGTVEAARFQVSGVVQGVGFRPFVVRLARDLGVSGWVRNDGGIVTIRAEAGPDTLRAFEWEMRERSPVLASIDAVVRIAEPPQGVEGFRVETSRDLGGARMVPPDAATCDACLGELFDPADRRYRYPFINCTDCGPRFTVIEALPYDRERTSMRGFPLCEACRSEYEDPMDRRFHAEPVACPDCGPELTYEGPGGAEGADPIRTAVRALRDGAIVALKGLGGFHLACDATNAEAVAELRERKRRPHKPFAVMVPTAEALDAWFDVTEAERGALGSWRAPIVLVDDRGLLAPSIAPGHRRQGAMLPSTPLHHLLTRDSGAPLVMTSGNAADEPICIDNDGARARLADIADAFLMHDRPIVSRYDDTVTLIRSAPAGADRASSFRSTPTVLRRARSYAPHPIRLTRATTVTVLGVGAELHGAFCIADGANAYLSQHLGDLDSDEGMRAYRAALDRSRRLFNLRPELVAHDLHPDFLTTRLAAELELPMVGVQHHHAHIAATMAEHGLEGDVLGIAFDGFGLGTDLTAWGGEFLRCSATSSTRIGHLRPVPQPGGDAAVAGPWRMAASHLQDAGLLDKASWFIGAPDAESLRVVLGQIETGLASTTTTSAGRLFDAVASLLGVCRNATYEGQPAILLEQAARPGATPCHVSVSERGGLLELDTRDLIAPMVEGLRAGHDPAQLAGVFHASFAAATARAATTLARDHGLGRVALGGGVFANDLFTTDLCARLADAGLEFFLPREVPVGDGGIALGQAVVAAAVAADGAEVV